MSFACYAYLKKLNNKPWIIVALVTWDIAILDYMFQVPANRLRFTMMFLGQLKVLQEVITLAVYVPFSVLYMH